MLLPVRRAPPQTRRQPPARPIIAQNQNASCQPYSRMSDVSSGGVIADPSPTPPKTMPFALPRSSNGKPALDKLVCRGIHHRAAGPQRHPHQRNRTQMAPRMLGGTTAVRTVKTPHNTTQARQHAPRSKTPRASTPPGIWNEAYPMRNALKTHPRCELSILELFGDLDTGNRNVGPVKERNGAQYKNPQHQKITNGQAPALPVCAVFQSSLRSPCPVKDSARDRSLVSCKRPFSPLPPRVGNQNRGRRLK